MTPQNTSVFQVMLIFKTVANDWKFQVKTHILPLACDVWENGGKIGPKMWFLLSINSFLFFFFFSPWLWSSYRKILNDLLFYCELSHDFAGWLKINFRTYINIFSMKLSWDSESSFLHEEFAGFVRVSKPILIFPLDIPWMKTFQLMQPLLISFVV